MEVKQAVTQKEKRQLDRLLWEVLWKPLNLPRRIRDSFKLETPQLELIVVDEGIVAGGLVANWLSDKELEVRHVAIRPDYQGHETGRMLLEELFKLVRDKAPLRVQTHARNTAVGFFTKLGFKPIGPRLNQKNFSKEGLWLQEMYVDILAEKPAG